MKGDDRMRHCSHCRLDVYNLSEMTEEEAEALLLSREGKKLCATYYLRQDGTILTKDCPKGVRAIKAKVTKRLVLAAAFVLSAFGCGQKSETMKEAFGLTAFMKQPPVPKGTGQEPIPGGMSISWSPKIFTKGTATKSAPNPKQKKCGKKAPKKPKVRGHR